MKIKGNTTTTNSSSSSSCSNNNSKNKDDKSDQAQVKLKKSNSLVGEKETKSASVRILEKMSLLSLNKPSSASISISSPVPIPKIVDEPASEKDELSEYKDASLNSTSKSSNDTKTSTSTKKNTVRNKNGDSVLTDDSLSSIKTQKNSSLDEPPPPSVQDAKLDLLKHLRIYLELLSVADQNANGVPAQDQSSSTVTRQPKQSTDCQAKSNISNDSSNRVNLYIDEEVEDLDANTSIDGQSDLNKSIVTNNETATLNKTLNRALFGKFDKMKPLIPLSVYMDNFSMSGMHLSEPFVGRDWLFKDIDKVFDILFFN
jgi:hypothetical protein